MQLHLSYIPVTSQLHVARLINEASKRYVHKNANLGTYSENMGNKVSANVKSAFSTKKSGAKICTYQKYALNLQCHPKRGGHNKSINN